MTPNSISRSQEASSAVAVDFSQGQPAHNQGQGLGAADATLPGNHRQEGGQDDQLLDGGLEEADNEGGKNGGA